MLAELVEFPNMRDWHVAYAKSHPPQHQSRAKFARGAQGADNEISFCGNLPARNRTRVSRSTPRGLCAARFIPDLIKEELRVRKQLRPPSCVCHTW